MNFFCEVFAAGKTEKKGDILHFRLVETVIVFQVLFFSWYWALYIPELNQVVQPVGIGTVVDVSFLFLTPFSIGFASIITLFLVLGYRGKGKLSYLLVFICMSFLYAARFSQGKIGHGSNYTGMALLIFIVAGFFMKDKAEYRKVALGLIIFFVGFGYVSAAFSKLIGTGPSWPSSGHLYLWINERSIDMTSQFGFYKFNFFQRWILDHPSFATSLLAGGWLAEFCGFLLWFKKTRWIEATLLIGMHIGIYLTMDITFNSYIFILLVAGYPWEVLFNYLLDKTPPTMLDRYLERESVQH